MDLTRNDLSLEAVRRRANLSGLITMFKGWDNDCWSKEVMEERPGLSKIDTQLFAGVLFAEANSFLKPVIRPE